MEERCEGKSQGSGVRRTADVSHHFGTRRRQTPWVLHDKHFTFGTLLVATDGPEHILVCTNLSPMSTQTDSPRPHSANRFNAGTSLLKSLYGYDAPYTVFGIQIHCSGSMLAYALARMGDVADGNCEDTRAFYPTSDHISLGDTFRDRHGQWACIY